MGTSKQKEVSTSFCLDVLSSCLLGARARTFASKKKEHPNKKK